MLTARPRGRTLPARTAWLSLCLLFCICSASFLCSFFCFSFAYLLGAYFFGAYFSAFLFGFVGRGAAVCTTREKPGNPHKQRLCDGFIFLKIFLKSSEAFFILFFILCIFQHIIYVQENVRRIRRRTLFPLYFLYSVVETAAALQALFPGLWLSHFLWRKKKKEKERNGAGVSLKKRYFSRFNFCYLVCRSLKCDFGKARLPKLFYQDSTAGRVLVLLRAVHNVTAAKSAYLYETLLRPQLKSVYTSRTLTPETLQ